MQITAHKAFRPLPAWQIARAVASQGALPTQPEVTASHLIAAYGSKQAAINAALRAQQAAFNAPDLLTYYDCVIEILRS